MPLASFMIQVAFLFTNNYKLSFTSASSLESHSPAKSRHDILTEREEMI